MSEIIHLAPGQALEAATLRRIADAAKACKIIAFPTDTVYGIGSTGLIKAATRRMYQIKARSALKPLPILVPSAEEARRWVIWTNLKNRSFHRSCSACARSCTFWLIMSVIFRILTCQLFSRAAEIRPTFWSLFDSSISWMRRPNSSGVTPVAINWP